MSQQAGATNPLEWRVQQRTVIPFQQEAGVPVLRPRIGPAVLQQRMGPVVRRQIVRAQLKVGHQTAQGMKDPVPKVTVVRHRKTRTIVGMRMGTDLGNGLLRTKMGIRGNRDRTCAHQNFPQPLGGMLLFLEIW